MPNQYLYTGDRSTFDNPSEVIFINQKKIAELDSFFNSYLYEVTELFAEYGLQFIYLPDMLTPEFVKKLLDYQLPSLSDEKRDAIVAQASAEKVYCFFFDEKSIKRPIERLWAEMTSMFSELGIEAPACSAGRNVVEWTKYTGLVWSADKHLAPPLTVCADKDNDFELYNEYHFAELSADSEDGIWEQLDRFFQYYFPELYDTKHPEGTEFSCYSYIFEDKGFVQFFHKDTLQTSDNDADEMFRYHSSIRRYTNIGYFEADELFTEDAYQLSQEIIERVEKLRKIGINELIIRSLVTEEPKPSRLIVTKDYRLFLPDYNNKEIVMGPLPKAVFLLFLRHPEGIMFKRMSEWKNELLGLYCRCAGRVVDEEMRHSVEKLTDPLSNSLNEKCSRIREAFLREMDDTIACNYYITGDRATPKRIRLDRELVEWEK